MGPMGRAQPISRCREGALKTPPRTCRPGWLSKLGSLFGHPKYELPYYIRDPKRDHNFDNHPPISGIMPRRVKKAVST